MGADTPPRDVVVETPRAVRACVAVGVALVALSLANTLAHFVGGAGSVEFVNLDREGNLPTWFQSGMLAAAALLAAAIATTTDRFRRHWWGLVALMAATSLDETAQIHELMIDPIRGALSPDGLLYWGWVIPGVAVVVALTLAYLPFVRAQDPAIRRGLVLAAALYVTGALIGEMITGTVADDFGYALATTGEETLEIAGQLVLVATLLRAFAPGGRLRLGTAARVGRFAR